MKLELSSGVVDLKDSPWEYDGSGVRNRKTGRRLPAAVAHLGGQTYQIWLAGQLFEVELASSGPRRAGSAQQYEAGHDLKAHMPGTVLAIKASPGDEVTQGQPLVVMESMKMELTLEAPRSGKVTRVLVQVGQMVQLGEPLLELEKPE